MEEAAPGEGAPPADAPGRLRGRRVRIALVVLVVLVVAAALLLPFQRYTIPSDAMAPGLRAGDHILVYRHSFGSSGPGRGDIVVVHPPVHSARLLVERVIGLPGETVAGRANRVLICRAPGVGCRHLREPYREPGRLMGDFGPFTDGPGQYFLLGDDRPLAEDSRAWGPVPERDVVGSVWTIYWPLGRFGVE